MRLLLSEGQVQRYIEARGLAPNRATLANTPDPKRKEHHMIKHLVIGLAAAILGPAAYADDAHHNKPAAGATQSQSAMAEGEVRKVDKDAKKITIKHGPLAKLDMPAMTMVFQVKDPAMLDQVKVGDKVKFDAEKVGAAFTVTKIEPVQ
jgi:Cu(I)/Ag(I) efflux system protein CusF